MFDRFRTGRRMESELDDELRGYVDLLTAEKIRSGMDPRDARRAALLETGGIEQVKESCRDARPLQWLESLGQDLRHALRLLRRNPLFSGIAILILSLGIGANSAAFSLVNAILLKNLPVHAPDELVWFSKPGFSYPIFQQVQSLGKEVFSGLFAWNVETMNVEWGRDVERLPVLFVTGDFYRTLGISAASGHLLTDDDNAPVALISYDAWRRRFGGDSGVIGKVVRIEHMPFTIVGVAPPGFFGVAPGMAPEITLPLTLLPTLKPNNFDRNLNTSWLHLMGRIRHGLSREQANAALQTFWPRVLDAIISPSESPERRAYYLGRRTELMPGSVGFSRVRNQFSEPLLLLAGLTGLLLLAACATIANLLLVRASARRREMAVRLAIGAARSRLIRQLVTESLLLAAAGTLGGWLFGKWGSSALAGLLATSQERVEVDLSLDWRVFGFLLALSILTVLISMLAPALRMAAVDPGTGLKDSPRTIGRGVHGSRLGKLLVISQVALAVLMVAGAALFVRNLRQLTSIDPGFERRNILLVSVDPLLAGYRDARLIAFYGALHERLKAVAGVESVSLSWVPPISNDMGAWTQTIGVDAPSSEVRGQIRTFFNVISSGYFSTIGQRLLRGRDFGLQDGAAATRVCIINESCARAFFRGHDPIGHRISIGRSASRQNLEIIGIVEDAKYQTLREPGTPAAYLPYLQTPDFVTSSNLMAEVRTAVPAASLVERLRRELRAFDPAILVRFELLQDRVHESLVIERAVAIISAFLGSVALILAWAGLYGLLAYTVSRRTAEIGMRIAIGASHRAVLWLVLKDCLVLSVTGVIAGLGAALALGRFAEKILYRLTPADPIALASTCLLMLAMAFFAALIPARRAIRVDPMIALRHE